MEEMGPWKQKAFANENQSQRQGYSENWINNADNWQTNDVPLIKQKFSRKLTHTSHLLSTLNSWQEEGESPSTFQEPSECLALN